MQNVNQFVLIPVSEVFTYSTGAPSSACSTFLPSHSGASVTDDSRVFELHIDSDVTKYVEGVPILGNCIFS